MLTNMDLHEKLELVEKAVSRVAEVPTAEEFQGMWPQGQCPVQSVPMAVPRDGCEEDFEVCQKLHNALYAWYRAGDRLVELRQDGTEEEADALGPFSREWRIMDAAEQKEQRLRRMVDELAAKLDEIIVRRGLLD